MTHDRSKVGSIKYSTHLVIGYKCLIDTNRGVVNSTDEATFLAFTPLRGLIDFQDAIVQRLPPRLRDMQMQEDRRGLTNLDWPHWVTLPPNAPNPLATGVYLPMSTKVRVDLRGLFRSQSTRTRSAQPLRYAYRSRPRPPISLL